QKPTLLAVDHASSSANSRIEKSSPCLADQPQLHCLVPALAPAPRTWHPAPIMDALLQAALMPLRTSLNGLFRVVPDWEQFSPSTILPPCNNRRMIWWAKAKSFPPMIGPNCLA